MMKIYTYLFAATLLFFKIHAQAQNLQVTGTVRDAKETIIGATIIEKGTANGTVSDINGNFKLQLRKSPAILVVTSIGYLTKETKVIAGNDIAISIQTDTKGLEEVVIVGYGQKKQLTNLGAVSQISGASIEGLPNSNVQNALAGRLPGFSSQQRTGEPGRDNATFYIRGVNSLASGASNPLVVIDDVEYTIDQVSQLDANEIETVSILKDATTTAIYGIKGANGVLVITTKRGKAGKPQFNFATSYGLNQYIYTPVFLDAYTSATLENQARTNDGIPVTFSQADLDLFKSGADPYGHPNTNWVDLLTKKSAPQSQSNLDISGGTDFVKYFVNLGLFSQKGQIKNLDPSALADPSNNYSRQTFRTNLDITPNKRLKLTLDVGGAFTSLNEPGGATSVTNIKDVWNDIWSYASVNPYMVGIRNPNGSWASNNYRLTSSLSELVAESGYQTVNTSGLNVRLAATHQLDFMINGLSANFVAGYTSLSTDNRSLSRSNLPAYTYNIDTKTYTNSNGFTQFPNYAYGGGNGQLTRNLSLTAALNYEHLFGRAHHVKALVLYNQTSKNDRFLLPVNSTGFTSQFDYDFKSKYLFEFTLARNGSDKFQGSKRFGLFPAVAVGYNIAEETFFKKLFPFVDVLKLKANVGLVGSDQGPAGGTVGQLYAPGGNYNFGASPGGTTATGYLEGALVNTDINWEVERKIDYGFDLTIFRNIKITADYFDNYRYDQVVVPANISLVFGQSLGAYNLGKTVNRGFEFQVTYNGKIGQFGYLISPNISYAKNKIIYDGTVAAYSYLSSAGQPIGIGAGYVADGFLTDADIAAIAAGNEAAPTAAVKAGFLKYLDINGDNVVDSRDQRLIGKPNLPSTIFGLNLGLNYKNFHLDLLIQGATDYSIKTYDRSLDLFNGNFQPIHLLSWTPATAATAKYPLLTTAGTYNYGKSNNSTYWLLDASYARLKQMQLSYGLPAKLAQKLRLKTMTLTASGYNLLTWTNYDRKLFQLDPEVSSLSTASSSSVEKAQSSTPNSRQYIFGIRIGF